MIDVLNAGSGGTSASRDKFPRAILPRTFDYGFATGLMVKDVGLYLDEAKALGVSVEIAEAVGRLWDVAMRDQGPDSDFTAAIKPIEEAAGVIVGQAVRRPDAAMSMKWTAADVPDQAGRVAVVTGANTGIGYETAAVLARRGANVVLAVRDIDKGEEAAARITATSPDAKVACNNST